MPFIHRDLGTTDSFKKIIVEYRELAGQVHACRTLGASRIVVTIGSWDMLHIGHVRYLMEASKFGDLLVVGVDSDQAIKKYKGPLRPIIPEDERREMLCYLSCVDFVTTIDDIGDDGRWQYGLIRLLKPDVFVAVEDSYPPEQREEISRHSAELVVLPRQAEKTSSTAIIQNIIKANPDMIRQFMEVKS